MRDARRGTARLLCLLCLSVTAPALSAPVDPAPAGSGESADLRTKLVLRIDGKLGQERESALAGLLGAELASNHVTLHVERSSEPLLAWTAAARRDPAALVLAILDVRDERAWALYVVDAARGRAILRRLPGGVEANAAALEEVAAILSSAVAAVREGLEVASRPVEAVVSGEPDATSSTEDVAGPPSTRPPESPAADARASERNERGTPATARPFAAVLARAATLAGRFVPGVAGEVGLRLGEHLRVLVHGSMDRPARFSTALGSFEVGRTMALLEAGYEWPLGPVSLEPRIGSGVEVIRRSGTAAAPGVLGEPGQAHPRFGAVAGARVRYAVAGPLTVELGADATYSPQRLRFTSGETLLASAPPFSVGALLGLAISP